jgi:bifunctional non-homologous end joining protein LigD
VALEDYRKKRNFTKTPEPSGDAPVKKKKRGDELFFCVQKHLASHLHYDFRLEWNGVLLSWAVPKGPSINPKDKRLAMQTEDHPFDYGMFEGVIPEGYGAGIVMLWDHGTWEPESEDVDAALRKGDLKFRLNGYKLKGSWVIVKTHGYGGAPNSWLLIKHRDDWAGPIDITEFAPLSVKTPDADFAEILSSGKTPDIWLSNAPAKGGDTGAMYKKIIERAMSMKAPKGKERTSTTEDTEKKPGKARAVKKTIAKKRAGKKTAKKPAKKAVRK